MRFRSLHRWDLPPAEAIALQKRLAPQVIRRDDFQKIRIVAGVDLSLDDEKGIGYAGVVLFEFPSLVEVGRVQAAAPLTFPYVPGLLSFREGPVLLKAFQKMKVKPDLILFDGQGTAHPRRFGIASHLGLILDLPSIGCAKSLLCGTHEEPGLKRGSWSPILEKGETIGAVVRTRDGVKPVFVSIGHRVGLKTAIEIVLKCHDGVRIPKPTRVADQFAGSIKQTTAPS